MGGIPPLPPRRRWSKVCRRAPSPDDEFPPRASTIVAGRGSRRLFRATVLFRHAADHVAIVSPWPRIWPRRSSQILMSPSGPRSGGEPRFAGSDPLIWPRRRRGDWDRDHRCKRARGRAVPDESPEALFSGAARDSRDRPGGRQVHPLGRGRLAAVSFDGGTTASVVEKMLKSGRRSIIARARS